MKFEKITNNGGGIQKTQRDPRPLVTLHPRSRNFGLNVTAAEALKSCDFVSIHVDRKNKLFMFKPEKKGQKAGNFKLNYDRHNLGTSYSVAGIRAVEIVKEMVGDFDYDHFIPVIPGEVTKEGNLLFDANKVEAKPCRVNHGQKTKTTPEAGA